MSTNSQANSNMSDPSGGGWRPSAGAEQSRNTAPMPLRTPSPSGAAFTPSAQPRQRGSAVRHALLILLMGAVLLCSTTAALASIGAGNLGMLAFEVSIPLAVLSFLALIRIFRRDNRASLDTNGGIVGEVRGFQQRDEIDRKTMSSKVWTFRVERYDSAGNRLPPVPVEMRGVRFKGFINEGDRVQLFEKWKEGQLLLAKKTRNLTTGVMVTSEAAGCFGVVLLLVSLPLFASSILLILSGLRG